MPKVSCERGDCKNPVKAHGLCQKHYDRERARHRHREDRVLATRARNRANAALVKAHPEEFAELLATATAEVQEEHAKLVQLATDHGVELDGKQIFRLKRGPAADDQDVEDRVELRPDETTCATCSRIHERGHSCPECGTTLGMPVERATSVPEIRVSAEERIKQRAAETAKVLSSYGRDSRYSMPPPMWDEDEEVQV